MISADLSGKSALVTGGASGIGLATVRRFVQCGATVAVNFLPGDSAAAEQVARLKAEGGRVVAAPGDVSDAADAPRMVADAIRDLGGRLDILVNNAGTPAAPAPIPFADLDAMTEEFWDRILATNLRGPFRCTRAAAAALKQSRGSVVNTASTAGLGIRGSSIAYAASKAGLVNLTRSLARALAPDVRVNAVAPSLVESPWTRGWPDEIRKLTIERTMLARLATPDDVAEAIFFLAVGGAYINGVTLPVDGGSW